MQNINLKTQKRTRNATALLTVDDESVNLKGHEDEYSWMHGIRLWCDPFSAERSFHEQTIQYRFIMMWLRSFDKGDYLILEDGQAAMPFQGVDFNSESRKERSVHPGQRYKPAI